MAESSTTETGQPEGMREEIHRRGGQKDLEVNLEMQRGRHAVITVPFVPPSQNVLERRYRNPHVRAKLCYEWKRAIYYSLSQQSRDWLTSMAKLQKRMQVRITIQHKKLYDKGNAYGGCKPVLDAIVRLGFLHDDSIEFCEEIVEQERLNTATTVINIRPAEES